MNIEAISSVWVIVGLIALGTFLMMGVLAKMFRKAGPHEALIVYGFRGTRIVQGSGTIIFPMVESCRDWEHKGDCSMGGSEEGESPLCSCCVSGSQHGTPLSLFPVFGIPYLEESQDRDGSEPLGNAVSDLGISQTRDSQSNSLCNRCRKVATKKYANCNVKYCSRVCQRQDWKEHKKNCEVARA